MSNLDYDNIIKDFNEYDYIFIFNSYDNNYSLDELEKKIRENDDSIGLSNEVSLLDSIKALLSIIDCNDNICLVIDNTIKSNNILDKVFWYKADINLHLKYKKICNKIGEWFLECRYNPKYKYCRTRLMKEFDDLYDGDGDEDEYNN